MMEFYALLAVVGLIGVAVGMVIVWLERVVGRWQEKQAKLRKVKPKKAKGAIPCDCYKDTTKNAGLFNQYVEGYPEVVLVVCNTCGADWSDFIHGKRSLRKRLKEVREQEKKKRRGKKVAWVLV